MIVGGGGESEEAKAPSGEYVTHAAAPVATYYPSFFRAEKKKEKADHEFLHAHFDRDERAYQNFYEKPNYLREYNARRCYILHIAVFYRCYDETRGLADKELSMVLRVVNPILKSAIVEISDLISSRDG